VPTVSLDELEEAGVQIDTHGNVYWGGGPRALMDRDLLRAAPYDDDDANRMYRKASGLE